MWSSTGSQAPGGGPRSESPRSAFPWAPLQLSDLGHLHGPSWQGGQSRSRTLTLQQTKSQRVNDEDKGEKQALVSCCCQDFPANKARLTKRESRLSLSHSTYCSLLPRNGRLICLAACARHTHTHTVMFLPLQRTIPASRFPADTSH